MRPGCPVVPVDEGSGGLAGSLAPVAMGFGAVLGPGLIVGIPLVVILLRRRGGSSDRWAGPTPGVDLRDDGPAPGVVPQVAGHPQQPGVAPVQPVPPQHHDPTVGHQPPQQGGGWGRAGGSCPA